MSDAKEFRRNTDPPTSHEAAEAIVPSLNSHETRCLKQILYFGHMGAICSEVCERTGLDWNSVSRRITSLIEKELVYVEGARLGPKGRMQRVVVHKAYEMVP